MPTDAKILILNYPHNPTGSFAPKSFFEEAVEWARKNKILIIHDMDNSEITHTGVKPAGIMQVEGAKDLADFIGAIKEEIKNKTIRKIEVEN